MSCEEKNALSCLYSEAIVALYRADVQLQRLQTTVDNDEYQRLVNLRREGHRILEQVRSALESHILQHNCGDIRPGHSAAAVRSR